MPENNGNRELRVLLSREQLEDLQIGGSSGRTTPTTRNPTPSATPSSMSGGLRI